MKKMRTPNLEHISGAIITELAKNAHCDESYVRKIVNGTREANTAVARAILRAAKSINACVEKAQLEAKQEFVNIDDQN